MIIGGVYQTTPYNLAMIINVNPSTGAITNFTTINGLTQNMKAVEGFVLDGVPDFYVLASNEGALGSGTTELFIKAHSNSSIDYQI